MKNLLYKQLYSLHSWVGLVTGILLFVVAFTGALSVFGHPELKIWSNPELRGPITLQPEKVTALVERYAKEVPQKHLDNISVDLPSDSTAFNLRIRFENHTHDEENPGPETAIEYEFDPKTYELLKKREGEFSEIFSRPTDMSSFITGFHADLHLGRPIGLLLTGLLGLTLMASVVTGILIHRKILKQFFTFRFNKNLRLMLSDGHKALGIWSVLFQAVIGFTGAFLGLALVILVPAAAFVSFEGDQEKLLNEFNSMPEPQLSHIEQPTQVLPTLQHALEYHEDSAVTQLSIMGWNDKNAIIYANLLGGPQLHSLVLKYQADGTFEEAYGSLSKIEGFSGVIFDIMFPLHFGNFGGLFVKIIWAVLGLSTALLPLTGLMLWIERGINLNKPQFTLQTYKRFNQLLIGSCGGLVLACVILFPLQLLLNVTLEESHHKTYIYSFFFGSWLICTFGALLFKEAAKTFKYLVLITGILLLAILPLDLMINGLAPLKIFESYQFTTLSINLVTFGIGFYLFKASTRVEQKMLSSIPNLSPVNT
ncbi:MAG: PepSY-associated TM helix domain-containing protein [Pseudomonadota bacterium]